MSERELIDEVMTLVVAGHETTGERAQLDVVPAVRSTPTSKRSCTRNWTPFPESGPSLDKMEALAYTHQIVDEALRLYPPGWILSRRTIGPDVLGGYEGAGWHERDAEPLRAASASQVLDGSGPLLAGALLEGTRSRPPAFRFTCRSRQVPGIASAKPSRFTKC